MKGTVLGILLCFSGALFAGPSRYQIDRFKKSVDEMAAMAGKFMDKNLLDEINGNTPDVLKKDYLVALEMASISTGVSDLAKTYIRFADGEFALVNQFDEAYKGINLDLLKNYFKFWRGHFYSQWIDAIGKVDKEVKFYSDRARNPKLKALIAEWKQKSHAIYKEINTD